LDLEIPMPNKFPALHNAMWPGLVGKGPGAEPAIDLDTMLDMTANAEVDGVRFQGVDLFLFAPHVEIDSTDDDLKILADKIAAKNLVVGSVVAPVWPPTGGASAMGDATQFLTQVKKACIIAQKLRTLGIRPYGIVRIDSATSPAEWIKDPEAGTALIAKTFQEAADIAEGFGERLAAEGEICWAGMDTLPHMLDLLEKTNRPKTLGFQADMAHTLLYTNVPDNEATLAEAYRKMASALRPWTIDFHVAQNDATVKGSGSHDKTGRHCLPDDPNGKLDIVRDSGAWMRDDNGAITKAFPHICWDGCMFPNEVMLQQETWNKILKAMIAVREAHGWN